MSGTLFLNASPWTGNSSTKKRTPTMNRKKTCRNNASVKFDDDEDAGILSLGDEYVSDVSENFESAMGDQGNRNSRVNELLNKITGDAGDGLADFVPVSTPSKKPLEGFESPLLKKTDHRDYSPNNSGEDAMSNYSKIYDPSSSGLLGKPYYANMGIESMSNGGHGGNSGHHSVIQKLNYITHILEEIQVEKTSNVTEELILYSFLGVFVIFVVDSFSKAGKYYR
jgi:hypothetical protein